jgi:hypothetical protein
VWRDAVTSLAGNNPSIVSHAASSKTVSINQIVVSVMPPKMALNFIQVQDFGHIWRRESLCLIRVVIAECLRSQHQRNANIWPSFGNYSGVSRISVKNIKWSTTFGHYVKQHLEESALSAQWLLSSGEGRCRQSTWTEQTCLLSMQEIICLHSKHPELQSPSLLSIGKQGFLCSPGFPSLVLVK